MTRPTIPSLDVNVEAGAWPDVKRLATLSQKAVEATCSLVELDMHPASEVGILLTDDTHVRSLNRDHRRQDKATNVLSFPISDPDMAIKGPLLGDIVMAFETVKSESIDRKKSLDEHFCHLIIHGFLHLFGYDHHIEPEAHEMEALEIAVMRRLGYSNPYTGAAF